MVIFHNSTTIMTDDRKVSFWKQLWHTTNGYNNFTSEDVKNSLKSTFLELELGLLYFKPASDESLTELKKKHSKETKILPIVERLSKLLDLNGFQSWDIMLHYLSNEYHGPPETALRNFTTSEGRINQVTLEIWSFYNSERLFMLKLLKTILETKSDSSSEQHKYSEIINSLDIVKLKSSLLQQFEYLVKESVPTRKQNGDIVNEDVQRQWIDRNLREQVEILQILLLTLSEISPNVREFKQLFGLFRAHAFGKLPSYSKHLNRSHISTVKKITYSEIAIFLKYIDNFQSFSFNNIHNWIDGIREDIEGEIVRLQHSDEHSVIMLAWMLLSLQDPLELERYATHYKQFGRRALQMNVFCFLYKMVTDSMFQVGDKCSAIVRKCVYNLLSLMCDKFDGDGTVSQQSYAFELCGELLCSEDLAQDFWEKLQGNEVSGVVSLWNTALEYFGFDTKMISLLSIGLADAGRNSCNSLIKELGNLPVYTEIYNPELVQFVKLSTDTDDVALLNDYRPLLSQSYLVKANSTATILERKDKTFIYYRTPISYWIVLYDDMSLILDQNAYTRVDIMIVIERVTYGIRTMNSILSLLLPDSSMPGSLINVCEATFDVLVRFIKLDQPPINLLVACLKTCAILVPQFGQEIFSRLSNSDILPTIANSNLTFIDYSNGVTFNSSLTGFYLVHIEQISGDYKFLMAYIDILVSYLETRPSNTITLNVVLPGLIFMLREVFPHLASWRYTTPDGKQNLTEKCVNFFFRVLEISPSEKLNKADNLVRQTCVYSFLNMENGLVLLKIISAGEKQIKSSMEQETNWLQGHGTKSMKIVQTSFAILMRVLHSKKVISVNSAPEPLELLIYTQPRQKDAMRIVPTVTRYMNHVFNKHLPILACRLLRLFAQEFQLSLLVCLDMSPHQIRSMFLERLRDKFESTDLKIDILQFVIACVEKQPGLTEVFFRVGLPVDKRSNSTEKADDLAHGMLAYMAEYLDAVSDNTSSLYSPLLSQIMGLFHALWKNNMQALVNHLREKPKFWENLCSPLFNPILKNVKAYSQILNMIGLELYMFQGNVDESLQTLLEKFFSVDSESFSKWTGHIFSFQGRHSDVAENEDEVPSWLSVLTSWKDFVMIFVKYQPISLNVSHKSAMVTPCLEALVKEIEDMSDNRTIVIISELFEIMLSRWKDDCFSDKQTSLKEIDSILSHTAESYDCLHPRAKRALLAIATITINLSAYELKQDQNVTQSIIRSASTVISLELDRLQSENEVSKITTKTNGHVEEHLQPIVLGMKLLEQCLEIYREGSPGLDNWLKSTFFVNKLLNCITISCQKKHLYHFTVAAFDCLSAYSRGALSTDLLYSSLSDYLWLQLLPPKDLIQPSNKKAGNVWSVSEWWRLYRHAIDFVTGMLMKHRNFFCDDTITFVGIHEDYLTEAVLLVKQTLDEEALNLCSSVLSLVAELVCYEAKWRQHHLRSLSSLMRNICACFHRCITLALRPRSVQRMVDGTPTTPPAQDDGEPNVPSPKMVFILNKLLELIHKSAVCLLAFSPDLLTLLAEPSADFSSWQPLVELHFGAPKLSPDALPALTFGTVTSVVGLLTRSLTHTYQAEEFQLSASRSPRSRTPVRRRRSCSSPGDSPAAARGVSRSDSVTSGVSAAVANLWLGALERRAAVACLESVLALLASQSLLAVGDPRLSPREKRLVRRELAAETLLFRDFVRKRVLEGPAAKNCLLRRKLGARPLPEDEEERRRLQMARERGADAAADANAPDSSASQPPAAKRAAHDSFRVSVVRKLHLERARENASTPIRSPRSATSSKRVSWADSASEEELLLPPEDGVSRDALTGVQLAEEDYFHFMSNLFLFICETDL